MSSFEIPESRIFKYPDGLDARKIASKYQYETYCEDRPGSTHFTEKYRIEEFYRDHYIKFKGGEWEYVVSSKHQNKNQLYLCIGGPMDGKKIYYGHELESEYSAFNSARGRNKTTPSMIFVHDSLLVKS